MERTFDSSNDSNYIYDDYYWTDDTSSEFDESVQASKDKKAEITIWEIITIVTCTVTMCMVIFGLVKIYKKGLVSANHIYIYLTGSLFGCFLLCIDLTIGAFLNIFRTYCNKAWHLCFYVEVFKSSLLEWIGVCLILPLADLLYTSVRLRENSMDDFVSQRIFANIFTVASVVILVVINSMIEHSFDDFPKMVSSCSKPTVFLNHLDFWATLELTIKSMIVIVTPCLIIAVATIIKHKLKLKGSIESSENGSNICRPSEDRGEEGDGSKCLSLGDVVNQQLCRKPKLDEAGVDNIGFVSDSENFTPWDPVSCSLSQMELARRFSHSTTLDTFVQLSPTHRQKLSDASLDCDHVLYALENFFMIDPAKIQTNMKSRMSNAEQSQRLIDDETSFSKPPRRRLMSMPGIKLRSKYSKKEDDNQEEKDGEKAATKKPSNDIIKKGSDFVMNKSKSFDGITGEQEITAGKNQSIAVEVEIHGGGDDAFNRIETTNCTRKYNEKAKRKRIKREPEFHFGSLVSGSESPEAENGTSENKAFQAEAEKYLDLNNEFDLLQVPSDEKQNIETRPDMPDQFNCKESVNTADEMDENAFVEGRKKTKLRDAVQDTVIENLDVDDISVGKKIQTELLSFKDFLKLMGQTTYSIVIVSLVYIILILVSSCYAVMVVSGGKENLTNEKIDIFEKISDLGQVVIVVIYVIAFEVRFKLFKNRTRK